MIDREKVIEELQLLRDFLMSEERKAFKGNNNSAVYVLMHYRNIVIDAIALLKEQEAIEPSICGTPGGYSSWWYLCGKCKMPVCPKERFCRRCGQAVKWDE